ncbi:hypothetical protein GPROT1_01835 [Gammaproteobacteria bacterium]|nr:hypothetical protein GPROT1_01835 [Gammaproteobacteria bacterium]
MLAAEEIWIVAGVAGAALLGVAALFLLRRGKQDYEINRHEGAASGFDFGAQQRELSEERARIESERKRAEAQAREMAKVANDELARAAEDEGRELQEMAQNATPEFDSPAATEMQQAAIAAQEAQAQALIRKQQSEVAAAIARQEAEIARIKAQQISEIERARAEYERAREAHFSLTGRSEPKPAIISYATKSPMQSLANTMQASYAQIAWAFSALARKME